jgi:hypothetical protein
MESKDGEEIKVKEFIIHPKYGAPYRLSYDFALLVLERATTQNIKLIRLNTNKYPTPGKTVRVMGWGRTSPSGKGSKVAKKVDVKVVSNADCKAIWGGHKIFDDNICAFQPKKKSGKWRPSHCRGDSGKSMKLV